MRKRPRPPGRQPEVQPVPCAPTFPGKLSQQKKRINRKQKLKTPALSPLIFRGGVFWRCRGNKVTVMGPRKGGGGKKFAAAGTPNGGGKNVAAAGTSKGGGKNVAAAGTQKADTPRLTSWFKPAREPEGKPAGQRPDADDQHDAQMEAFAALESRDVEQAVAQDKGEAIPSLEVRLRSPPPPGCRLL